MYIHKSQALPSKHSHFKPAKQTLLFTVTATWNIFHLKWDKLCFRGASHTGSVPTLQSIPLDRVWLQVPELPGGEEEPGNPAGAATCPTAQPPAPGLGKLKLYWRARGSSRQRLVCSNRRNKWVQVSEHRLKGWWHNYFRWILKQRLPIQVKVMKKDKLSSWCMFVFSWGAV